MHLMLRESFLLPCLLLDGVQIGQGISVRNWHQWSSDFMFALSCIVLSVLGSILASGILRESA